MLQLRISKSNFMTFDFCKYLYKKEVIDGIRSPPTPVMELGTDLHKYYENIIMSVDQTLDYGTEENPRFDEDALNIITNINQFEDDRKEIIDPLLYPPVICEEKFTKIITIDDVEITMVGKPDAVFREDDGTLNIMELKTGNWKDYKKSKIRKELVFYAMLLEDQVEGEITNISWFYPKANYFDTEPIKKRTKTAVMKQFDRMIESYKLDDWFAPYHENKCANCQFLKECVFR